MKKYIKIILGVIYLSTLVITAQDSKQETKLEKANLKYENLAYIDAAKIYLKVAESGYESEELFSKLGNIYYFKSDYKNAEKWYRKLYKLEDSNVDQNYLLRYSQSLRAVGKEKDAKKMYDEFLKTSNSNVLSSSDYDKNLDNKLIRYDIDSLSINTEHIDYGGIIYNDTLYFSSTRSVGRRKVIDSWSGKPFLDIYTASYNEEEDTYGEPTGIKGDVNTKFHECTPVFTKDGKTMYFTRTNSTSKSEKDKNMSELRIYRATKVGEKWTNIKDLSINGDGFSNAHPVLSPDEKTLYFASNMPLSIGGTDLFSSVIYGDGTLGTPVNMGTKINTKGRESFPFVTEDNELYFSSDGHYGYGGYDVFYVDLQSEDRQLINIGKPINGANDDFAFSINNRTKKGFFSSNRSLTDNIYAIRETRPIKEMIEATLRGIVIDKETKEPLSNATVSVNKLSGETVKMIFTDDQGRYETSVNKFMSYTIVASKDKYDTTDKFIPNGGNTYEVNFELDRNQFQITTNEENPDSATDLSKVLKVKQIYFDLDKYKIREDAKVQLEKIIATMEIYPKMVIEIRSHTDSRALKWYNDRLSNQRSKSILDYLTKRGISEKRLVAKGFGESQLLNKCSDDVECTEEEHQLNRRSEFIVLSLN